MALLRDEVHSTSKDGRRVAVRSATPRDAAALAKLMDAVAGEPDTFILLLPGEYERRDWKRRISDSRGDPATLFLVAEVDGRLAACSGLHPDPHPAAGHVRWLGMSVGEGFRGVGVGTALLEAGLGWARDHGVVKLELGVFPHNTAARAFYARHGFVDEGVRRAHYVRAGHALDEVLMGRFLEPAP